MSMEQKIQEQIEGSLYHQAEMLDSLEKMSKSELTDRLKTIKYNLRELKEHGLGDSDCEREKYFLQREYDMIMNIFLFQK